MSNGNQLRQRPVRPSRSIQQFVTRNGGSANATAANKRNAPRPRLPTPHRNSATANPRATDNSVVSAATSKLFWSKVQFTKVVERTGSARPVRRQDFQSTCIGPNRRGPREFSGPRPCRPQRAPKANGLLKNSRAFGCRRGCGQNARGPLRLRHAALYRGIAFYGPLKLAGPSHTGMHGLHRRKIPFNVIVASSKSISRFLQSGFNVATATSWF